MVRKVLVIVFMSIFVLPLSTFAANSLFGEGNTPVQSFHESGGAGAAKNNTQQNSASEMAKVKAIMQRAKEEQQSKQSKNPAAANHTFQTTNTENTSGKQNTLIATAKNVQKNQKIDNKINSSALSAATSSTTLPMKNINIPKQNSTNDAHESTSSNSINQEIATLNQTRVLFQQRTDQQLVNLANQNKQLEDRVKRLREALLLMNQEVMQMKQNLNSLKGKLGSPLKNTVKSNQISSDANFLMRFEKLFGGWFNYVIYFLLFVLVLLIVMLLPKGLKKADKTDKANSSDKAIAHNQKEDIEGDYDYLQSEEAIPAKLDLARSYMAMEDFDSAREVLTNILNIGDANQCEEAQSLLNSIPAKS